MSHKIGGFGVSTRFLSSGHVRAYSGRLKMLQHLSTNAALQSRANSCTCVQASCRLERTQRALASQKHGVRVLALAFWCKEAAQVSAVAQGPRRSQSLGGHLVSLSSCQAWKIRARSHGGKVAGGRRPLCRPLRLDMQRPRLNHRLASSTFCSRPAPRRNAMPSQEFTSMVACVGMATATQQKTQLCVQTTLFQCSHAEVCAQIALGIWLSTCKLQHHAVAVANMKSSESACLGRTLRASSSQICDASSTWPRCLYPRIQCTRLLEPRPAGRGSSRRYSWPSQLLVKSSHGRTRRTPPRGPAEPQTSALELGRTLASGSLDG